ncbi:ESX secretion-associated protein EspG [Kibdelosporangium lantanae]
MTTADYVLSHREFDIVWSGLGFGQVPYPLQVASVGRTMDERDRIRADVDRDLADREVDRRGLADVLAVLADHTVSIDSVAFAGRPLRALAVSDERTAVLAEVSGDQVLLAEIRPTSLTRSIVGLLANNAPGPGRAVSVPAAMVAAAAAEDDEDNDDPFADDRDDITALTRAGVSETDAGVLAEMAGNRVAGGQFGVCVHGDRVMPLVTWFDTSRGRYLLVSDDSWLSFAPADNERIQQRLETVLTGRGSCRTK